MVLDASAVERRAAVCGHEKGWRLHSGPIDTTITNAEAKPLGRYERMVNLKKVEAISDVGQKGSGLHGGATDVAHLSAKAFLDIAHYKGFSIALLYVDARSAYASVVRSWTDE
jgi:hypothetical protein